MEAGFSGPHRVECTIRSCCKSGAEIKRAADFGWDGDFVEAQAFAYLAARSVAGLPLSLPETTGVPYPMPGGVLAEPSRKAA
jgi:anhydro-N-acetylmuramic acid kinase